MSDEPLRPLEPLATTARVLGLLLLWVASGCESPTISLGLRNALDGSLRDSSVVRGRDGRADSESDADVDDDNDETQDDQLCSSSSDCTVDPDEALCNTTRGVCVECLRNSDCRGIEVCEPDGECESPI